MRLKQPMALGLMAFFMAAAPVVGQDMPLENAGSAQESSANPDIPKLALPPFDRTTDNYKLALEIVQISMPPDKLEKLLRTEMGPAMEVAFGLDPNMAQLEAENPGFISFLTQRFVDFITILFMANFDYFEDATAIDFVTGLTMDELREYRAFLETGAGKKMVAFGYDAIRLDGQMLSQSIENDDPEISDAIVTVDSAEALKLAKRFSPQEIDELMAFIERPVFEKVSRINAVSSQSAMDSGLEKLLDEALIEQLFIDIFEDFFAAQ